MKYFPRYRRSNILCPGESKFVTRKLNFRSTRLVTCVKVASSVLQSHLSFIFGLDFYNTLLFINVFNGFVFSNVLTIVRLITRTSNDFLWTFVKAKTTTGDKFIHMVLC